MLQSATLPSAGVGSVELRVLDHTRKIFGGPAAIVGEIDPETNEECLVVTAVVSGTVEEIVAGNDRWHRELRNVCGEAATLYRLDLDPL